MNNCAKEFLVDNLFQRLCALLLGVLDSAIALCNFKHLQKCTTILVEVLDHSLNRWALEG